MSEKQRSEEFDTNSWLVEEMYERYRDDPESVGAIWNSLATIAR